MFISKHFGDPRLSPEKPLSDELDIELEEKTGDKS